MLQNYRKTVFLIRMSCFGFCAAGLHAFAWGYQGDEAVEASVSAVPEEGPGAVSQITARDRAKTMFRIYSSTLDVMHDHYFHVNKAVLPARAMEDIFRDVEGQSGAKARWIAVNAKAMSVDHEPADDFEKEAAKRIAAGEKEVEQTTKDVYRFAGSIPLQQNCVQCHMGTFTSPSTKQRFAGLVISIPVRADSDATIPR